jgi:hypothetical protein
MRGVLLLQPVLRDGVMDFAAGDLKQRANLHRPYPLHEVCGTAGISTAVRRGEGEHGVGRRCIVHEPACA